MVERVTQGILWMMFLSLTDTSFIAHDVRAATYGCTAPARQFEQFETQFAIYSGIQKTVGIGENTVRIQFEVSLISV